MPKNHQSNKYCAIANLRNESDVEQFFLLPLLDDLGFGSDYLETKATIPSQNIGKGKKKKIYLPDYLGYLTKAKRKPVLVIDAKHPKENANDGVEDAQMYASVIRRAIDGPKPDQFCIGSNGHVTIVKHHDSNQEILRLKFHEFLDNNPHFIKFKSVLSRTALQAANEKQILKIEPWVPVESSIEEIKISFSKCHSRIWKRESLLPTAAFYEFTKLIFLKLREDERIHRLMDKGKAITLNDLHFHTFWIDNNSEVSPHPINSILFRQLNENLAEQVDKKKKKKIFDANEQINLKPSTTRAVVELLQDYDLHGIDEDLNGRMFEVFLSAAVRGKNLGAFFTPRNVVKLMVNMSRPSVERISGQPDRIDMVLDGCCGSGGFLIDAMAFMLEQIRTNASLLPYAKDLEEQLLAKHLYGIESNPDIVRIARINMFLHGDGGSRIYRADTLDKEFHEEEGEARQDRDEIIELKDVLVRQEIKFDVILTNPPFASAFSATDEHEKRILLQYTDLHSSDSEPATKTSAKSNVLFLARYYDLLRPGGRMAIVLDNSMLNSHNFAEYRKWLLEKFILRAVISLPKYSFIQAGAGGVTSILYVEKKTDDDQEQPPIFARTVHFTGISKSGKEIKENDLKDVLAEWKEFEKTGKLLLKGKVSIGNKKSDDLFLIFPNEITDRIDVAYHTPSYSRIVRRIDRLGESGSHTVKRITDFELADRINVREAGDEIFKYLDIGAIDAERCEIIFSEVQEGTLDSLPARARIKIKENDVIFPLSFDSLGKVAIVPKELDGQLASTGFVVIRNKSFDEAVLLWSIIRSEVMQKQFRHVASGYTQRGLSTQHLGEIRFPIPVLYNQVITDDIKEYLDDAENSRRNEIASLGKITELMKSSLDHVQDDS